jgi:hypothetical protein
MDDHLSRVEVASPESCLTSKESRAVRRGVAGKVPAQVTRRPSTLLYARFGGGRRKRGRKATAPTAHPTNDVGRLTAHDRFPLLTWSASRSRDRSPSLAERFAMRVDVDNHGGASAVAHQFKTSRGTTPNPGPVGTWTRPSW